MVMVGPVYLRLETETSRDRDRAFGNNNYCIGSGSIDTGDLRSSSFIYTILQYKWYNHKFIHDITYNHMHNYVTDIS